MTLLCTLLFIASDAIAGLGVQASNKCDSVSVNGMVTSSNFNRYSEILKMSRTIGSISQLSAVTFLDSPISVVPQKFPKDLSSPICTTCLSDNDAILSNCVVEDETLISSGELVFTIGKTGTPLQTIVHKVEHKADSSIQFEGRGDLILDQFNFDTCTMFYFGSDRGGENTPNVLQLDYFEYNNSTKCQEALDKANQNPGETFTMTSDVPVSVQKITCDRRLLDNDQICMAMVMHRTFEYEISVNRNPSDPELYGLRPLHRSDPILAVLAFTLAIGAPEPGRYEVYTSCGTYDWRFISPFFGLIAFLIILLFISQLLRRRNKQALEYGLGSY